MKETGLCDNRRTVPQAMVEDVVLKGIEEKLAAPEVIAEYVREYHRITRELHSSVAHRRRDLKKPLGNVNSSINKAVDAILAEAPSRALRDRSTVLEAEHDRIETDIANIVPPTVEFHPNAGDAYSSKIRDLKAPWPRRTTTAVSRPIKLFRRLLRRSSFIPTGGTSRWRLRFMANSPPCSGFPSGRPNPKSLGVCWLRGPAPILTCVSFQIFLPSQSR
jgi:hypothetical protein